MDNFFLVKEYFKNSDINNKLIEYIKKLETDVVSEWIRDMESGEFNPNGAPKSFKSWCTYAGYDFKEMFDENPSDYHGLACESSKLRHEALTKDFKLLRLYDWCGFYPLECQRVFDPLQWEDEEISKYLKKNIYDIITKHLPDIDRNSLMIAWTNIHYPHQRIPGKHHHYFGEKIGNQYTLSGNYYVDATDTFTRFDIPGLSPPILDIKAENGMATLFDGKYEHNIEFGDKKWGFYGLHRPRISISFDVVPGNFIHPYYNSDNHHRKVSSFDVRKYINYEYYEHIFGSKNTGVPEIDILSIRGHETEKGKFHRLKMLWELDV